MISSPGWGMVPAEKDHMKKWGTIRFIYYQIVILGLFASVIIADEALDLPHYLLGDPPTSRSQRYGEIAIEIFVAAFFIGLEIAFIQKLRREIKVLEGFIPICASCKNIRNIDQWQSLEEYISTHSLAEFSHSICPACLEKLYPEVAERLKAKKRTHHIPPPSA